MAGLIQIGAKVTRETADQFAAAFEASGCETKNQFYELILEKYLNPKAKIEEVPRPTAEQLQEIQLKDNEIGRLKTDLSLKSAEIEALGEESRQLAKMLSEVSNQAPAEMTTEPGTIQIVIPPIIAAVLDIEQEIAAKKSGKVFTAADILLNNFWESIKNGVSRPYRIWSGSELSRLATQLKEAQQ